MKMHIVQSKLIRSLYADRDFLDWAGAIIATRSNDGNLRRLCLVCGDEVILRESHLLALVSGGHMVSAVLFHMNRTLIPVAVTARELNCLSAIERQLSILQGMVHLHFDRRIGTFDRAQV